MKTTATATRVSLKNILYATDFSPAAEAAMPYVKGLADRYGSTVHALHVKSSVPYPITVPEAMPELLEAEEEQSQYETQELDEAFRKFPHKVRVQEGAVWPLMSDMIRDENIDLIVVGTHGRTGVGRALLGSGAEEILRRAPCPVFTVGPRVSSDTERRLKMKQILLAMDFSPECMAAAPYAMSLAQEHQAKLTILNVVGAREVGDLVHPLNYKESTIRMLRKLVPPESEVWCEPQCVVEHGPAAEKILETAAAVNADLIVLGTRSTQGHLGAATHLLTSTIHTIVTLAECPVLTVRG